MASLPRLGPRCYQLDYSLLSPFHGLTRPPDGTRRAFQTLIHKTYKACADVPLAKPSINVGRTNKVMDPEKHCLQVAPNVMFYPSQRSTGGHSWGLPPSLAHAAIRKAALPGHSTVGAKFFKLASGPQPPTTAAENGGWEGLRQLAPQGLNLTMHSPADIRRNAQHHCGLTSVHLNLTWA